MADFLFLHPMWFLFNRFHNESQAGSSERERSSVFAFETEVRPQSLNMGIGISTPNLGFLPFQSSGRPESLINTHTPLFALTLLMAVLILRGIRYRQFLLVLVPLRVGMIFELDSDSASVYDERRTGRTEPAFSSSQIRIRLPYMLKEELGEQNRGSGSPGKGHQSFPDFYTSGNRVISYLRVRLVFSALSNQTMHASNQEPKSPQTLDSKGVDQLCFVIGLNGATNTLPFLDLCLAYPLILVGKQMNVTCTSIIEHLLEKRIGGRGC